MNTIYIGIHHTFHPSQESENKENAFVSTDLVAVRAWCDSFKPVEEYGEICEWRSIAEMDLNKDYCKPAKYDVTGFDIDVPTVYSQD